MSLHVVRGIPTYLEGGPSLASSSALQFPGMSLWPGTHIFFLLLVAITDRSILSREHFTVTLHGELLTYR